MLAFLWKILAFFKDKGLVTLSNLEVARSSGGGAANVASSVFSKLPSGGAQSLCMVKTT